MKEPTKAILVINMPEQCDDCDFCQGGDWLSYLCGLTGEEFEFVNGERKHFCPLKPLPQKRILPEEQVIGTNYGEEPWFTDGYNACLDEILGEKA